MKNILFLFVCILFVSGCNNDDSDKNFQLPPETQTGANTFGVTIKGKVYIPRDPTGGSVGTSAKGMIFWGTSDSSWNEIEIKDGASAVGFNMIIHLQNLETIGTGQYILSQSNFHNGIDSVPYANIYFKIWDSTISNYAYYGSIENQGEVNITRFNGRPTVNWVLSGNFKGKFVRYDNPNDFIEITDGRFDLNLNTLSSHLFP